MAEMGGLEDVGGPAVLARRTDRRDLVRDTGRAGRPAPADRNPGLALLTVSRGSSSVSARAGVAPAGPDCRRSADRLRRPRDRLRSRSGRRPPGLSASTATEGAPTGGDVNAEAAGRGGRVRHRRRLRVAPGPARDCRDPLSWLARAPDPVEHRHLAARAAARFRA